MANKDRTPRQYTVEEEQQLAQEAQQRGMTVEDLKREKENNREQVINQGTDN